MTKRRVAVASLLALVIIFFIPLLWGGKVIFPGDNLYEWYPWAKAYPQYTGLGLKNPITTDPVNLAYPTYAAVARSIGTAGVMLWDPYTFSGSPVQTVSFYPPYVLLLVAGFSPAVASTISIIAHAILSALLMYAFCRVIGLGRWGATFAGAIYALNGYVLVWLEFETIQRCLAWLPGVAALILLAERRRRLAYVASAGVLVALIIAAGNLQFAMYDLGLIGLFAAAMALQRRTARPLLNGALAIVLGLALTSVYWVQQYTVLAASTRQSSPNVGHAMPPENAVTIAWPGFFGNPVDRTDWGELNYTEGTLYFGVIGIACIVLGLLALKRRERAFLIIFMILVTGIAMRLPLFRAAELLPILRSLGPSRHIYILVPIMTVLAGIGFDRWRQRMEGTPEERLGTVRFLAILALLFLALPAVITYLFRGDVDFVEGAEMTANGHRIAHFVAEAGYPIAFWFALLLLAALPARFLRRTSVAMIALACLDLMIIGWHYNTVVPRGAVYPPLDEISYLKTRAGKFRVAEVPRGEGAPTYPPNTLKAYGIETVSGFGSFLDQRYIDFARMAQRKGPEFQPQFVLKFSVFDSPLLDAMNVRYLLSTDRRAVVPPHFVKRFDVGYTRVFENTRALPRAYSPHSLRLARSDAEAKALLSRPAWRGSDEAIVQVPGGLAPPPPPRRAAAAVSVVRYGPHDVEIQVRSADRTFVVLADSFAEGWRATVDGSATPIYRTNYIQRGVSVPAGDHLVRFTYRPAFLSLALAVSAFLAAVAAGLAFASYRLDRNRVDQ